MRHLLRTLLLVSATLTLGTTVASAEIYLAANMMGTQLNDSKIKAGSSEVSELTFSPGYGASLAIGTLYHATTSGRFELETSYKTNSLKDVTVFGGAPQNIDGSLETLSVMFNSYHEYDVGFILKPFVGLGIGMVNLNLDLGSFGEASDTVFAYQASIGESYPITSRSHIDLQYRYVGTSDTELSSANATYVTYEAEYASHNLMLGFRHTF